MSERLAERMDWELPAERREFVPDGLPDWTPFPDAGAALRRLADAGYRLGILSNIDDDLLTGTRRHFPVEFDLLITAESLRSYKPAHPHFLAALETIGGDPVRQLHIAQSVFHDVRPARALGIPTVWVNRQAEPPPSDVTPTVELPDLASVVDWLESRSGA